MQLRDNGRFVFRIALPMPLVIFNKPFRVISQFSEAGEKTTLAAYLQIPAVYPAGRLDYDSEGLLLLSDDGRLQARISSGGGNIHKSYWAQVDGLANTEAVRMLETGVDLKDGPARAVSATLIDEPDNVWPRDPPIRVRKELPTSWISITLDEGRNRQVRRMTAAAGFPTLRLIRHQIGPWSLTGLAPGEHRIIDTETAWHELKAWQRA